MDAGVAGFADHEGLVSLSRHDLHPVGWIGLSRLVEISERSDQVHTYIVCWPAELASAREESVGQLRAARGCRDWFAVPQDRVLLPSQRDTAERRDQWFPALATLDADL
jgi:hypothetical protein